MHELVLIMFSLIERRAPDDNRRHFSFDFLLSTSIYCALKEAQNEKKREEQSKNKQHAVCWRH